eukprot:755346-Lingulodinium_polyedra.AAC.1
MRLERPEKIALSKAKCMTTKPLCFCCLGVGMKWAQAEYKADTPLPQTRGGGSLITTVVRGLPEGS